RAVRPSYAEAAVPVTVTTGLVRPAAGRGGTKSIGGRGGPAQPSPPDRPGWNRPSPPDLQIHGALRHGPSPGTRDPGTGLSRAVPRWSSRTRVPVLSTVQV